MSVDESTVIFGPIDHVGWARASSTVTSARSARVRPRNGPPDAVSTIRATSSAGSVAAAQALVDGAVLAVDRARARRRACARTACTTGPPAMSDSLLASAEALAGAEGGEGDVEAGEADDAVEHDVGGGGRARRGRRARRAPRCPAGRASAQLVGAWTRRRWRRPSGGTRAACAASRSTDDDAARATTSSSVGLGPRRRRASGCRSTRSTRGSPACARRPRLRPGAQLRGATRAR